MNRIFLSLFLLTVSSAAFSQEIIDVSYLKSDVNSDSLSLTFDVQLNDSISPDSIIINVTDLITNEVLLISEREVLNNSSESSNAHAIYENAVIRVSDCRIKKGEAYHAVLKLKTGGNWSNEFVIDFK